MTVDNNKQQKNERRKEQLRKANAKYQAKTYKNRTICIKLKDLQTIDDFLKSRNQSATQYFYDCLKRDGVIE